MDGGITEGQKSIDGGKSGLHRRRKMCQTCGRHALRFHWGFWRAPGPLYPEMWSIGRAPEKVGYRRPRLAEFGADIGATQKYAGTWTWKWPFRSSPCRAEISEHPCKAEYIQFESRKSTSIRRSMVIQSQSFHSFPYSSSLHLFAMTALQTQLRQCYKDPGGSWRQARPGVHGFPAFPLQTSIAASDLRNGWS